MELRSEWFDPDSIYKTVTNLMESFDRDYLRTVSKPTLEKDLTREILMLSVYDRNKEREIAAYIHENIDGLYNVAKRISRQSHGHFFSRIMHAVKKPKPTE